MSVWSAEAGAMVRPIKTYRHLAERAEDRAPWRVMCGRPALFLFIMGGVVSLTAAGRLVPFHVAATYVFWGFAPVLQLLALAVVRGLFVRKLRLSRVVDLYFVGQGPWLMFFLGFAGVCLFAPSVYGVMTALLFSGALPIAIIVTQLWSMFLTAVCMKSGYVLTSGRALTAFLVFYLLYGGAILAWFMATNQLLNLVGDG